MTQTQTPPSAANYLDPRTLATIGSLDLRARMIVEGLMSGMHRSPYQGSAVEFAQHRQYAPGDDIRRLDWKVYGRTDKLYLKQFQKETNLDLVVMVDVSGSMGYGSGGRDAGTKGQGDEGKSPFVPSSLRPSVPSWTKYDHAASIAAAMAYLALRQQDRVGLVLFAGRVLNVSRMSNAHDHWRTLAELLAAAKPGAEPGGDRERSAVPTERVSSVSAGEGSTAEAAPSDPNVVTDLARVFDQSLAKLTRRSLVVLISDLFDSAESLERALARLHHRRHDLLLLQTLDPAELTFPFRGPADFIGFEREGRVGLDPSAIRKAYLEALYAHLAHVEETTRKFHFDHVLLNTAEPLGAPLSHFLARRAASIGKGK